MRPWLCSQWKSELLLSWLDMFRKCAYEQTDGNVRALEGHLRRLRLRSGLYWPLRRCKMTRLWYNLRLLTLGIEELFFSDSSLGVMDLTLPALDSAPCEGTISPPTNHNPRSRALELIWKTRSFIQSAKTTHFKLSFWPTYAIEWGNIKALKHTAFSFKK